MSNSNTMLRATAICGLAGSLLTLTAFAIGIFMPDNNIPGALVYGTAALLLLIHVVGLLRFRKGHPEALSTLALAGTILGLSVVAIYAAMDILARMGLNSVNVDDYWTFLMMALLLLLLSLSVYAITASVARTFPAWLALPLAATGGAIVLIVVALSFGMPESFGPVRDAINTASIALLIVFFALWGVMSAVGLRQASAGTPASPTPSGLSRHNTIPI